MNIKNKKIKYSLGIILLLSCLIIGGSVLARPSDGSILAEWGDYLKNNADVNDLQEDDIYARGKNAVITNSEIDQTTKFFMISGLDEEEANIKAIEYCKEREALYQAAIQNGYTVTDEEVWEYLDQLKEVLKGASNKDDAMSIINQFDSEDDYWNYEFTVYQKNLPIQNYVADLEKNYFKDSNISNDSISSNKGSQNSTDSESGDLEYDSGKEEKWQTSFDELKKDLVADEDFEVVNQ